MEKNPKALEEINRRLKAKEDRLTEVNQQIKDAEATLALATSAMEAALEGPQLPATFKLRYSYPDNIPDYIKNLPIGAQRIFVDVFNKALDEGKNEDDARQAGWGAVKTTYERQAGGEWVRKASDVATQAGLAGAYALHNQLHLEYVTLQMGQRRRAEVQAKHEALVWQLVELGGIHQSKGDQLDETLPLNLKGTIISRYVTPLVPGDMHLNDVAAGASKTFQSIIQVLRTGTFYHPIYGKFTVLSEHLANMVNNFKLKRPKHPTEMVVDYEHMSAPASPVQMAPAAGWVKGVEQRGNELYCTVEWTEAAATKINNKEYRFISPEFSLNYRDKETNQALGPTLIALALTNRPFVEGMQPVALSDEVAGAVTFALNEKTILKFAQFNSAEEALIAGTSMDAAMLLADWDIAYINDLPDSAFAYIAPGGEKDDQGKTVPRSLRFLPYRNKAGDIDPPHLRNALARLPQTDLSADAKAKAQAVLDKAAKAAGIGAEQEGTKKTKEATLDEKELRKLLKLDDNASIPDAITALVTKAATADDATRQLNERKVKDANDEAIALVDKAIADKKLLPKQKDTAVAMCLKDKAGLEALIAAAPVVGPDTKEKGTATDTKAAVITATEKDIAGKMGVTDEMLLKVKQADAAAKPGTATT